MQQNCIESNKFLVAIDARETTEDLSLSLPLNLESFEALL